jgi:hypothetical protein
VPDNDNVPEPVFVKAIKDPLITPEMVAFDEALNVASAAIVTVPERVAAAENFTAPADDTPVPEIVKGSAELSVPSPANSSVAPLVTVVDERVPAFSPRPVLLETFNVPADTDVLPVYVLAAESVNEPPEVFVTDPVPRATVPEMVAVPELSTVNPTFVEVTPDDNVRSLELST